MATSQKQSRVNSHLRFSIMTRTSHYLLLFDTGQWNPHFPLFSAKCIMNTFWPKYMYIEQTYKERNESFFSVFLDGFLQCDAPQSKLFICFQCSDIQVADKSSPFNRTVRLQVISMFYFIEVCTTDWFVVSQCTVIFKLI